MVDFKLWFILNNTWLILDFKASFVLQKHLYLHMCIFKMVYNTDYKLFL